MDGNSGGLRLHLHENRNEAVGRSSTLDFVSLSACDEDMVQQCNKAHMQAEALKHKRNGGETGRGQRKKFPRTPPSEHLSSEGVYSELDQFELGHRKHPKSNRVDESGAGGSKNGPVCAKSSRVNESRVIDGLGISSSDGPSPHPFARPFVTPRVRSLRLVNGTTQSTDLRPLSSLYAHCPSQTGSFGELSSLSLSGVLSPLLRTSTETPPGVANAFEVHEMRVKCLAPKRPMARTLARRHDARSRATPRGIHF